MQSAIIVFPGSNCDRDAKTALHKITGKKPHLVWHQEKEIPNCDLMLLPGGFSFGDYLRSGAIAAKSPIMQAVRKKAGQGVKLIGICNGFQILTEAKLLPGTLMRNKSLKFICRNQPISIINPDTAFTKSYKKREINRLSLPIAHMDGNYHLEEIHLNQLRQEGQIVFEYLTSNPNGSVQNIAGIMNKQGNILGLMPHPERAIDPIHTGMDGIGIFQSLMEH